MTGLRLYYRHLRISISAPVPCVNEWNLECEYKKSARAQCWRSSECAERAKLRGGHCDRSCVLRSTILLLTGFNLPLICWLNTFWFYFRGTNFDWIATVVADTPQTTTWMNITEKWLEIDIKNPDCFFLRAIPLTIAKMPLLKIVGLLILGQETHNRMRRRLPIAILLPTYVTPTLMTTLLCLPFCWGRLPECLGLTCCCKF